MIAVAMIKNTTCSQFIGFLKTILFNLKPMTKETENINQVVNRG